MHGATYGASTSMFLWRDGVVRARMGSRAGVVLVRRRGPCLGTDASALPPSHPESADDDRSVRLRAEPDLPIEYGHAVGLGSDVGVAVAFARNVTLVRGGLPFRGAV